MRILAIETSGEQCSVALARASGIAQRHSGGGSRVSERALSTIAALLAAEAVGLESIDAFAFGSGPGAFTGLRVACALAQGLAFARGRPVVAVGSLRALAHGAASRHRSDGAGGALRVMAAIDARMGQIYCAVYESAQTAELAAPALAAPEHMAALLQRWQPQLIAGDALRLHASAWPAAYPAARMPDLAVDAAMVAELARVELAAGHAMAARDAAPHYVRDQVALTVGQRAKVAAG